MQDMERKDMSEVLGKRFWFILAAMLVLTAAGCGGDGEQAQDEEAGGGQEQTEAQPAGDGATAEQTAVPTTAEVEQTSRGGVTVGGFSVEGPGIEEATVPQVSVDREAARQYLQQVRPIVDDTARDISGLVQPDVSLQNGNLSLDVEVTSLEEARAEVQSGLERLRELDPPEGLGPINQQLIEAYEQALPAYDNIIQAAESGDPQQVSNAVQESLPRIERFNDQAQAIVQDLEQATGEQR
jgi:hypothetical protein